MTHFSNNRGVLIVVVALTIIGGILRFSGLVNQSLSNDELFSWSRPRAGEVVNAIDRAARVDVHPPGYHVIVSVVSQRFGNDEFVARFPSAIAGTLCIPLIVLLGMRIGETRAGIVSAALLAASEPAVHYSQEGRAYALLLLLSIVTALLWIRAFCWIWNDRNENRARRRAWGLVYVLAAAVMCYLHAFGLLLASLQLSAALLIALLNRRGLGFAVIASFGVAFLYAPWIPAMVGQMGRDSALSMPPVTYPIYFFGFLFSNNPILMCGAATMLIISLAALRERRRRLSVAMLWCWMMVPGAIGLFLSYTFTPVVAHRNLLVSMPAVFLLFGIGVDHLLNSRMQSPRLNLRTCVATAVIVVVWSIHLVGVERYYKTPRRAQFREAMMWAHDTVEQLNESTLVIVSANHRSNFEYYGKRLSPPLQIDEPRGPRLDVESAVEALETVAPEHVVYLRAHVPVDVDMLRALRERYESEVRRDFYRADVWYFSRLRSQRDDDP